MPLPRPTRIRHALLLALTAASPAMAAQTVTIEDLARRLQALEQRLDNAPVAAVPSDASQVDPAELDQRLRILERKLELQAEEASAKAATQPTVKLDDKGLSVKSASPGGFEVKFRGLLQGDGRFFFGDAHPDNTFLLRRVEPGIEGSWGSLLGFRLNAQLAGDSATVNDAYFDLKFDPRATVRIGRYKGPVGLERLQSSGSTAQIETGFPSELVPNRDVGVQLQGEFARSTVSYVLGVYNGAPDGRDGFTTNPDDDFELAGRVFLEPWKNSDGPLSGLGFGLGASRGEKHGNGNNFLPRYRTPGQVTFFNYLGGVDADGEHVRWSPQAYYYRNAFGLVGEYVASRQDVLLPATGQRESLANRAWQLGAGWVLTGEDADYKGVAAPDHPFTADGTGWGAFELVARYGELKIDDDAFPLFADPFASASRARSWGVGLNWYLTRNFKLMSNYTRTAFEGGAADGMDRDDEEAFFTRAQFSF